jgi:hypothetical protein
MELNDYSGEFIPDVKLEQFSKKSLIELLRTYSRLYLGQDGFWYLAVKERNGDEEALACDLIAWDGITRYEMKQITRAMHIDGNNVAALIKTLQLIPEFWRATYSIDLKDDYHAILSVESCPVLEALEREGKGREYNVCNIVEPRCFKSYASFFNPDIDVTCLKSPPRKTTEPPCCQWEFKQKV